MAKNITQENARQAAASESGERKILERELIEQLLILIAVELTVDSDVAEPIRMLPHFLGEDAAVQL